MNSNQTDEQYMNSNMNSNMNNDRDMNNKHMIHYTPAALMPIVTHKDSHNKRHDPEVSPYRGLAFDFTNDLDSDHSDVPPSPPVNILDKRAKDFIGLADALSVHDSPVPLSPGYIADPDPEAEPFEAGTEDSDFESEELVEFADTPPVLPDVPISSSLSEEDPSEDSSESEPSEATPTTPTPIPPTSSIHIPSCRASCCTTRMTVRPFESPLSAGILAAIIVFPSSSPLPLPISPPPSPLPSPLPTPFRDPVPRLTCRLKRDPEFLPCLGLHIARLREKLGISIEHLGRFPVEWIDRTESCDRQDSHVRLEDAQGARMTLETRILSLEDETRQLRSTYGHLMDSIHTLRCHVPYQMVH
ncbi:hypothetical protein Tco_1370153 [Tanacetum coccineum]